MSAHREAMRASVPFLSWFATSTFLKKRDEPNVADFMFGNPQQMPLPAFVDALSTHVIPHDRAWFAYKMNEPEATRVVAQSLTARTGVTFEPDDVFMTNGGFAAIAVALQTICEPSAEPDEIIFLSPPWFFYELLIRAANAKPVRVTIAPPAFDLPVEEIAKAIGPRTRGVLVNSPHNPSGRVWSKQDFAKLATVLEQASARYGHPIWILSDEPYAKIVFDGRRAASPAEVYPHTFVLYSYGKQLLTPGQRVGYAAVPSTLPNRESLRPDVLITQCATGFAFPNALLQHALADIEGLSIDIGELERRRDRLVPALRDIGYETTFPEGTFYVLVRAPGGGSPAENESALESALADRNTFVLPGSLVELPGWVRVSLTANDEMIEKGIVDFRDAMRAITGDRG
jgi:aspartate aminotransferase